MKRYAITFMFSLFMISFSVAQFNSDTPTGPTTIIEFEEQEFDFGVITEGERISHLYVFTNTGDKPLVIKDAKGSCGCTVPMWPKEPILPGESAELLVEFNSKGKGGMQSKRVTITANTNPAQTYLTIKGEIKKKEGASESEVNPNSFFEKRGSDFEKVEVNSVTEKAKKISDWKKENTKDCFAIFPNPTADYLKLELKEYAGKKANIYIFNSKGKEMKSRVISEITDEILEFDVSNYSAGTYYVSIQIDKKVTSTKCFVVTK